MPRRPTTLEALDAAVDDYDRFAYAAHAAKVRRDLLIRKAHREGVSLRQIGERVGLASPRVSDICTGPAPELQRPAKKKRTA